MPPFQPVPAKPDHVALEHSTLERWERERTFETLRDRNRGHEPFSFIDGPITANNPMGVHHGWGRTLKDIWQRYAAMRGHDLLYQNGFDCQGLWVEVGVEKELGLNSKREIEEYGLGRFARACRFRPGDDDLVARPPGSAQRPAEMERQRGHVGAEHNFGGRRAEKVGERGAGPGNDRVGFRARGVGPVRVRVVAIEVVLHRLHDGAGNLGASRPIEVRNVVAAMLSLEGQKLGANV